MENDINKYIELLIKYIKDLHFRQLEKMENDINKYIELIIKDKPSFIKTINSYERLCLYKALEKYGKEKEQIWFNRKKEYIDIFCKGYMCKRHRCKLSVCDDYNGDYRCDKCGEWEELYGYQLLNEGDFLCKSKVTVGLNIYYVNPNLKKIKSAF